MRSIRRTSSATRLGAQDRPTFRTPGAGLALSPRRATRMEKPLVIRRHIVDGHRAPQRIGKRAAAARDASPNASLGIQRRRAVRAGSNQDCRASMESAELRRWLPLHSPLPVLHDQRAAGPDHLALVAVDIVGEIFDRMRLDLRRPSSAARLAGHESGCGYRNNARGECGPTTLY